MTAPKLELTKHTEFRWFGADDAETLTENRQPGDTAIRDLVMKALTHIGNR